MAATFEEALEDVAGLAAALESIQLSEKLREELRSLFEKTDGFEVSRDRKNRVRASTVHNCSKIGGHLTTHYGGVGPQDKMMWIGFVRRTNAGERWLMRGQIRAALVMAGWFGQGPAIEAPVPAPAAPSQPSSPVTPEVDLAKRAARFALVKVRPQQAAFREAVFDACRGRCIITGCSVPEALEAAHLTGRSWEAGHNSASDGILLRRDLHTLYDRGLMTIDEAGRVLIESAAIESYEFLHGSKATLPNAAEGL